MAADIEGTLADIVRRLELLEDLEAEDRARLNIHSGQLAGFLRRLDVHVREHDA